jgi:outer membrane receptor protein involved in Fe transport
MRRSPKILMEDRMLRWLAAACLVVFAAASAHAQTANVTGTVVDEQGAGVPGATVQLSGTSKRDFATSGPGGAYTFSNVAAGTYELTATLVGFAPASGARVVVGSSETPVAAPALTLKVASFNETVVVSATKTNTALVDAPATMSVLTSAQIESSPAQNYGDLLRSVPGLNVVQLSARDVNITARQATGTLSNTQLVILDGRSVYLDFFGVVLWDLLPTNMSDVKQIEVVRGPASAVWGANALTGVVNIITKTPRIESRTTRRGHRRRQRQLGGCAERPVVLSRRRRLVQFGGVSAAGRADSADSGSPRARRDACGRADGGRRVLSR